MKEIYEMKGPGCSIRDIARELDIARNTVRRYLKDPEAVMPKPRRRRASKLDPFIEYMDRRLSEGLENCVVLWRELQGLGYPERLLPGEDLCVSTPQESPASGHGEVRDGARGAGTGGLGQLQLRGDRRQLVLPVTSTIFAGRNGVIIRYGGTVDYRPTSQAIEAKTYGRQDTGNGSGQGWDERAFSAQLAEWPIAVAGETGASVAHPSRPLRRGVGG